LSVVQLTVTQLDYGVKSKNFALVLKEQRLKAQLSQEALANLAGLHRTYISQLERSERSPSLETAMRISEVLNIPFKDFASYLEKNRAKR
jgi:transcriptional regulator with XRE-family HTH domain